MIDSTNGLKGNTIGVLYGGPSAEREVSIESGENCAKALESAGYQVRRVLIEGSFNATTARTLGIDLALLALHGEFGEDGTIQGILEEAEIPYTGSGVESSALAFNKSSAKLAFKRHKVRTPRCVSINAAELPNAGGPWRIRLAMPVVVKPAAGGSSLGVSIVRDSKDLDGAIRRAAQYDRCVLVEQYIRGRELTVAVLGSTALPPAELKVPGEFYDYEAKYKDDRTQIVCPAELDGETISRVQAVGLAAHQALGCRDLSRADIILDQDGTPWVLEVNTLPGMTSHSLLPRAAQAAGKNFAGLCEELLGFALQRAAQHVA